MGVDIGSQPSEQAYLQDTVRRVGHPQRRGGFSWNIYPDGGRMDSFIPQKSIRVRVHLHCTVNHTLLSLIDAERRAVLRPTSVLVVHTTADSTGVLEHGSAD